MAIYKYFAAFVFDLILTIFQTYFAYGYYVKVMLRYSVPLGTDSFEKWWLFAFYWSTFLGLCVAPILVIMPSICDLNPRNVSKAFELWSFWFGCAFWISLLSFASFILFPIYMMIGPLFDIAASTICFYGICFGVSSAMISIAAWIAVIPISLSYFFKYSCLNLHSFPEENKPLLAAT
ncbi:MAG: hypothetical protein Harvfovirus41_7 [Harvfovirus sp.]|uniref:Uncharacterized protein n=1 Tax=Harvfovirus sp. TaxID=2487768 RepID=A0A3G5A2X0_9VIRU|nr:MAG: hypothetical protein Harvfovirus41_7 [Harvfovirus sp.]